MNSFTWIQNNTLDHTSAQALAAIQNAGFELLRHPPYSPFVLVLHGTNFLNAHAPRMYGALHYMHSHGKNRWAVKVR